MLFVRPGELRSLEWSDIDFKSSKMLIPAAKMKMDVDLIVPLSRQALEILTDIQELTGHGQYVFAGHRDPKKFMSENTVNQALRRMGFSKDEISGHGFRATARTLLSEELDFKSEYIEVQLAHKIPGPLGDTYNRAEHVIKRGKMMQAWSDYLDQLIEI